MINNDYLSYFKAIRAERGYHESFESLLKRFREKEKDAGIIKEIKDRYYFEKPSEKQRKKDRYRDRTIDKLNNKNK